MGRDRLADYAIVLALLVPAEAAAQQDAPAGPTAQSNAQGGSAPPPSVDMLEFLGDWQTGDGGWLDPAMLDDDSYRAVADKTDGHDAK